MASGSEDGTVMVWDMTTAPALDELPADDDMAIIEPELVPELRKSQGGRRSRKKNNRNKKRVKTLNKKKYRSSRTRRFRSKNKK